MSNLSAKYIGNVPVQVGPKVSEPAMAVMYLEAGIIPVNLIPLSTQTKAYRDAMISMFSITNDKSAVLRVLLAELQNLPDIVVAEQVTLCELAATIAYFMGEHDLVKEILIRVPSNMVSSYIKTLYTSIAIRGWNGEFFKSMMQEKASLVMDQWTAEKERLGIN